MLFWGERENRPPLRKRMQQEAQDIKGLQVILKELLNDSRVRFFIAALDLDGNGIAALNNKAHDRHQLGSNSGLAVFLLDGDGAVQGFSGLGEHTSGAGMNTRGVRDGVGELFHDEFSL